jgi:hypothetical protein
MLQRLQDRSRQRAVPSAAIRQKHSVFSNSGPLFNTSMQSKEELACVSSLPHPAIAGRMLLFAQPHHGADNRHRSENNSIKTFRDHNQSRLTTQPSAAGSVNTNHEEDRARAAQLIISSEYLKILRGLKGLLITPSSAGNATTSGVTSSVTVHLRRRIYLVQQPIKWWQEAAGLMVILTPKVATSGILQGSCFQPVALDAKQ